MFSSKSSKGGFSYCYLFNQMGNFGSLSYSYAFSFVYLLKVKRMLASTMIFLFFAQHILLIWGTLIPFRWSFFFHPLILLGAPEETWKSPQLLFFSYRLELTFLFLLPPHPGKINLECQPCCPTYGPSPWTVMSVVCLLTSLVLSITVCACRLLPTYSWPLLDMTFIALESSKSKVQNYAFFNNCK